MFTRIKKYFVRAHEFGIHFVIKYHIIGRLKSRRYKQNVVLKYISKDIYSQCDIKGINKTSISDTTLSQPIWVCWWQGEEHMPPIVKACYKSLHEHNNGHKVNLITEKNVNDYITLPSIIIEKLNNGIISLTHLSDILRVGLLANYGGLWVDSTIFFTGDLPEVFPEFYSLKQHCIDEQYISDYRWTGYFIGGSSSNIIFSYIYNYFTSYWQKHNLLIDYFLLDYVLAALTQIKSFCKQIDETPISNQHIYCLNNLLNERYDGLTLSRICTDTDFHKLSWKGEHHNYDKDGHYTFYGKLCQDII